jgi:hypothetical protein
VRVWETNAVTGRRPVVIIHSLAQARAALAAAASLGTPVTLASAEGAAGYAGAPWFKAIIDQAQAAVPEAACDAILDCGGEPGTLLGALRHGVTRLRFSGPEAVAEKLAAIAQGQGAAVERCGPPANLVLDLLEATDPEARCRAFLETLRGS